MQTSTKKENKVVQ